MCGRPFWKRLEFTNAKNNNSDEDDNTNSHNNNNTLRRQRRLTTNNNMYEKLLKFYTQDWFVFLTLCGCMQVLRMVAHQKSFSVSVIYLALTSNRNMIFKGRYSRPHLADCAQCLCRIGIIRHLLELSIIWRAWLKILTFPFVRI
jgi:uncharacterized membrane protein